MKFSALVLIVACITTLAIVATQADNPEQSSKVRRARFLGDLWDKIKEHTRCRNEGETCHGSLADRCCDNMHCYREDELEPQSVFQEGVCVTCIHEGNNCQRDTQCCYHLKCVKERIYGINGVCSELLGKGLRCHYDDECQSNNCVYEHKWSLHGKCDDPRGHHGGHHGGHH